MTTSEYQDLGSLNVVVVCPHEREEVGILGILRGVMAMVGSMEKLSWYFYVPSYKILSFANAHYIGTLHLLTACRASHSRR